MTTTKIFTTRYKDLKDLALPHGYVLLHGVSLDERGENALSLDESGASKKLKVAYFHETMRLEIGTEESSADNSDNIIRKYISAPIVFEATTLGLAELFCTIRSVINLGVKKFDIIYGEPADYTPEHPGGDSFALSNKIVGYRPIPNAVVDLSSENVEAGVFFLGYEPERLERALEEYQMISSKEIKVVFGVPAFKPGWELNSFIPHLPSLSDKSFDIAYCSANDPSAAYELLERTKNSLGEESQMFVAPIGTKPCGVATALFASLNQDRVGILYDHPDKKSKRSRGVGTWHKFTVIIP
ncbi:hypothetical protein CCL17_18735 [Pseudomonas congelans]|uniref:hypothetical protein n=1 Tax=Pseudomonas congelans TaxID=200452 RepID=UPI000BB65AB0|nr:hypothetical protein [Pseudomonas congelans]PBP99203.1 hypothetical protein CCL17_18735 [Pseudomonas congelans]